MGCQPKRSSPLSQPLTLEKCLRHFAQAEREIGQHNGKIRERVSECECEVTQSCPTLCDPMDCSLPCSSVHGIFQARVLEWVAFLRSLLQINCLDSRQNAVRFKSKNFLRSSGDFGGKQLRSQSPNDSKMLNCSP